MFLDDPPLLLLDFERQFIYFNSKSRELTGSPLFRNNLRWTDLIYLLYGGLAGLVLHHSISSCLSSLPFIHPDSIRFNSIQLNSYIYVLFCSVLLCSCRFLRCRVRVRGYLLWSTMPAVLIYICNLPSTIQSTQSINYPSYLPCLLKVPTCFQTIE